MILSLFSEIVKLSRCSVHLPVFSLNLFIIFRHGFFFLNGLCRNLLYWRVLDLNLFQQYVPYDQASVILEDIPFCSSQVFFTCICNQNNPFQHEFHKHLLVGIMKILFKSRYLNSPMFGHLIVFFSMVTFSQCNFKILNQGNYLHPSWVYN